MDSNPMEDWGIIQKVKALRDNQAIESEKQKQLIDKKIYKKQLDAQRFLRDLEKEEQKKVKEVEASRIASEIKLFEQEETRRKEEFLKKQAELTEMLETHKGIQKLNQEMQKVKSTKEEQKYLQYIQEQIEIEERQKKERRDLEVKQKTDIMSTAKLQQELKKREKEKEMLLEKKLIDERKAVEEKREQEHQAFFKMLSMKQNQNTMHYNEKILSKNQEKEVLIDQWINKRMEELERKQNQEARERARRKQEIIMMNHELMKKHLENKEMEKEKILKEKQRMLDEVSRKTLELKSSESEQKLLEKQKKKEYFEALNGQSQELISIRKGKHQLNEIEKMLNKDFIADPAIQPRFQMQGNSIINSPINKNLQELRQRDFNSPANMQSRNFRTPSPPLGSIF